MGYLGRRIGKSQNQGDSNPSGADGAVGGGILNLFENGYFERQGDIYNAPGIAESGISASGGTLEPEGVDAPNGFTYHVFTGPGTFTVDTIPGGTGDVSLIDVMVIGGGGAGGRQHGGGGGAGSVVLNTFTAAAGSYPITVGDGGTNPQSGPFSNTPGASGSAGGFSRFGAPGEPVFVHANGGGGGAGWAQSTNAPGGGSAGGRTSGSSRDAGELSTAPPTSPSSQDVTSTGGRSFQNHSGLPDAGPGGSCGGGGGGAGGLGGNTISYMNGTFRGGGPGGIGLRVPEFAAPLFQSAIPTPDWPAFSSAVGPTGLYGGGGGGGGHTPGIAPIEGGLAGPGGGGIGGDYNPSPEAASGTGGNGTAYTGGGGGGGGSNDVGAASGGKGIVCLRYKTNAARTSISVSNPSGTLVAPNPGGYEIRYFTASGALTVSSCTITDAEVVVVAGGGGNGFGGGGGGGVVHARNVTLSPTGGPGNNGVYPVVIGGGGSGRGNPGNSTAGGMGVDSFFGAPSATGSYLQANGGGGTVGPAPSNVNTLSGAPGGSGGGGGHPGPGNPPWNSGGTATQPGTPQPLDPTAANFGNPGGSGGYPTPHQGLSGGAGGGAGSAGYPEMPPAIPQTAPGGGQGGDGYFVPWCPESLGDAGAFGGGGGGAYGRDYTGHGGPTSTSPRVGGGGLGGGGNASGYGSQGVPTGGQATYNNQTVNSGAHANTGGGAGGNNGAVSTASDGIVLVRYRAT